MAERGVRFVQVYSGGGHQQENWDAHQGQEENLLIHAPEIDRPVAALLVSVPDIRPLGLTPEEKKALVRKLHHQFYEATPSRSRTCAAVTP